MRIENKLKVLAALFSAAFLFAAEELVADESASGDTLLESVMAEYWDFSLEEDPLLATQAGVSEFNDRLPSVTQEDNQRRLEALQRFRGRVRDIDPNRHSDNGRINREVFEWVLDDAIGAIELELSRIPFNTFSGFFMDVLTATNNVRMVDVDDYEAYIVRMQEIPRYFEQNTDNMNRGMQSGFMLSQVVIDNVLPSILAQSKDNAEDSSFFAPFKDMNARIPAKEQDRLRAKGRRVISDIVMPAFAQLGDYLSNEYEASATLGAEELATGRDYYAFQIRRYTTIRDLSSDEIHDIGLAEVARIKAEMLKIIASLEFDGGFKEFAEFLRTDARFYAETPDQLLKETAYTAKRIDYVMPGFFGILPRQSYGIVPVPEEVAPNYTTGAYYGTPPDSDRGGAFWINTYALDQRPLYELPALTLHEAVPGHHHQNAIAAEMQGVPDFRKHLYFSAFGEGWALYTEKLGVEMGIYQTPYEHFGRLSYEMWRACRLVIDTGLHAKDWSRQRAIDYFAENTALSEHNIRSEVDRYISWPGQALAYKLGELKIWELRNNAEQLLGSRFDLREFHDVILKNGALPMAMLESVVERYIDRALSGEGGDE